MRSASQIPLNPWELCRTAYGRTIDKGKQTLKGASQYFTVSRIAAAISIGRTDVGPSVK